VSWSTTSRPPYPNEIDVFDESNRPNGTAQLQAVIAPKLPKASGELKDEIQGRPFVQRQVTEDDAVGDARWWQGD
jgi:hypothetical protein